jgi:pimeloyl-ACP methyl ester carboxylesterase
MRWWRQTVFGLLAALVFTGAPADEQERKTVKVGDLTVSYGDAGAGQPLVLVHGGGLSSRMWQWFAPVAAAKFRVLTPDTRGHGGTDNPGGKFTYDLAADDLTGFIDALGLQQPIVMGYSDGGIIALTFVQRHPGKAKAAVVGGASHKIAADPHYFDGMTAFYGYDKPGELPDAVMDRWAAESPDLIERYRAMHGTPDNPERWRELYKTMWPVWTTPLLMDTAALAKVETPTLLMLAQRDEFFTPEEVVELSRLMPASELAILPGVNHTVVRTNPDLFNAVAMDFLNRQ